MVIRSCDSETKISQGFKPEYFKGTLSKFTTAPSVISASSPIEDDKPPAPLSVLLFIKPFLAAMIIKSESFF